MTFPWPDQAQKDLARMVESGDLSCSQIADALSAEYQFPLTRNAIIGKIHRLGLRIAKEHANARRSEASKAAASRRRDGFPPREVQRETRRQLLSFNGRAFVPQVVKLKKVPPVPLDDNRIPLRQRKGLLQLEQSDCRWPIGEPGTGGFFFCGAPAETEQPYCYGHCRKAFTDWGR